MITLSQIPISPEQRQAGLRSHLRRTGLPPEPEPRRCLLCKCVLYGDSKFHLRGKKAKYCQGCQVIHVTPAASKARSRARAAAWASICVIITLYYVPISRAQGNLGSNSSPVVNRQGIPLGGVSIAVCQPIATTGSSVSNGLATLVMSSNPITAGYVANMPIIVAGFTGADTYLNAGTLTNGKIVGGRTILSVSSTSIIFPISHANASVSTNGTVLQEGNGITSCAGLAPVFQDPALSIPSMNPFASDQLGNWNVFATSGVYYVQFYAPNITTTMKIIGVALVSISGIPGLGLNNNWTGINIFSNPSSTFAGSAATATTATTATNVAGPGSLSGTLSGNPTLNGNPIFGGLPSFIGNPAITGGNAAVLSFNVLPTANFDAEFSAVGTGDVHLRQTYNTTTSTTTVAPGNVTITVSATCLSATNCFTTALGANLLIGDPYDTSTNETILSGNWSITDGTHFNGTFAKNHAQPYNVSQTGTTVLETDLLCQTNRAFTAGLVSCWSVIGKPNGVGIEWDNTAIGVKYFRDCIPGTTCDFVPRFYGYQNASTYGLVLFGSSGLTGTSKKISFSTNDVDDPTGAATKISIDPGAGGITPTVVQSITSSPATTGFLRLANIDKIKWRDAANGSDHAIGEIQTARFTGNLGGTCPTAAAIGAACTSVNLNWGSAFADNNYTPTCSLLGAMTGQPHIVSLAYQAAGVGITITIAADTAVATNIAPTGIVSCIAVHD